MVDFGGWDMPVQYPAGTIEEHLRTRTHAGLFDVSHMGEIDVKGADAITFVNRLTSNDVTKLIDGQAQYSALTTPQGTVIDDLLVYRLAQDHLLLVVNASTTDKDWDWIKSHHAGEAVELNNVSADYCQLALQGPDALSILQKLTKLPLNEIKYYHFTPGSVDGVAGIVSRTDSPPFSNSALRARENPFVWRPSLARPMIASPACIFPRGSFRSRSTTPTTAPTTSISSS